LINDPNIVNTVDSEVNIQGEKMFTIDEIGRQVTFKLFLIEASIKITNALINYEDKHFIPVTDNPHMSKLFTMRGLNPIYTENYASIAPTLGLEIIKSLFPDEALNHLLVKDILEYRTRTKDVYHEWLIEINKISTHYDNFSADQIINQFPKIMAKEITPKISEYRNEMKAVRNEMFKDLLNKITNWKVPTLSLAAWAAMGPSALIGAFIMSATNTLPDWINYFNKRKATELKHSISYLLKLT
jgi:hypothetical protein